MGSNLLGIFIILDQMESLEKLLTESEIVVSCGPTSATLEVDPAMGYADLIVDIISSGNTVRQNKLKTIKGGDVIASQACLIANRSTIQTNSKLQTECDMLTNAINSYLKSRA